MFSLEKEHIIFTYAHRGALRELQQEIAENPDLLTLKASNGSSLLMFAAQKGHNHVVAWLVDNGAKLDDKASNIYTALMFAAFDSRVATVKYLLNKGAAAPEQRLFWLYTTANAHRNIIKWMCQTAIEWQLTGISNSDSLPTELSKEIHKIADFTVVLPYLKASEINILVNDLQDRHPTLLQNIRLRNFVAVWNYLALSQQEALIASFQKQMPQLIDQAQKKKKYSKSLWEFLTLEQRTAWLTTYAHPNEDEQNKLSLYSSITHADSPKEEVKAIDSMNYLETLSAKANSQENVKDLVAVTFFTSAKTKDVPADKTEQPRSEPSIN